MDGGWREIVLFTKRAGDGIGEAEILKGGQKVVLSIKAVIVPGKIAWNRMKAFGDTRVSGASSWVS